MIVLHSGLRFATQRMILGHANRLALQVELRTVKADDSRYPISGWVSDAVYLRLAIGDALPDQPAALYLDADVLVLGDLRPLLTRDLAGAPLGAVRDPQNPIIGEGVALPGWEDLGLPADREYFNSGVMLLDLVQCERLSLFEHSRRFLAEHPGSVRFWDQDALNWAADGNWLRLERRWNTFALSPLAQRAGFVHHAESMMPLEQLLSDEDSAAVLHFAGPEKPWLDGYPPGAARDLYLRSLNVLTRARTR